MGNNDAPPGPPYPPRTNGYVDCLNPAQELALVELCKQLPSASEGLAPEHLTLWGVPLTDLANSPQQPWPNDAPELDKQLPDDDALKGLKTTCRGPSRLQKVVLLKFLRARQFNVQAAIIMLVNCLKWRRDFDVAGLSLETFPPQLGAAGQLSGRDRAGNPVTYNYYGTDLDLQSVFGSPGGVATFVRWRVKLMEQAVALLDFEGDIEHVTQVHDYSGLSMFRMDSNVKAASRQIIKLFQDNYPEMLSAKLFLNVPRVMEFVFGLFSAFSDAATRAKFVMASPARARAVLLQYIDPVQLPDRFGGFLETCSVPPKQGRANSFSAAQSKTVVLSAGESHVTSKLVGPDSEVVWCFCSSGPEINMSLMFRPRDNGEAAAAAAELPDHVPGAAQLNSRHLDAQHLHQSHRMVLVKDAASGRLVLGCPGEVVMTLDYKASSGFFLRGSANPPATVHYALLSNEGAAAHGSLAAVAETNGSNRDADGGGPDCGSGRLYEASSRHPLDWRSRMIHSYKSLGCSSFASNDGPEMGPADAASPDSPRCGTVSGPLQPSGSAGAAVQGLPPQPSANGSASGAAAHTAGRFEPVEEVDESATTSPTRSTMHGKIGE